MTKEFVPHQEALDLKELGFDEPCLKHSEHKKRCENHEQPGGCQLPNLHCGYPDCTIDKSIIPIPLPLYQQAFRWFREKHNMPSKIEASQKDLTVNEYHYFYQIMTDTHIIGFGIEHDMTYEESELACLKKLIELVKQKS